MNALVIGGGLVAGTLLAVFFLTDNEEEPKPKSDSGGGSTTPPVSDDYPCKADFSELPLEYRNMARDVFLKGTNKAGLRAFAGLLYASGYMKAGKCIEDKADAMEAASPSIPPSFDPTMSAPLRPTPVLISTKPAPSSGEMFPVDPSDAAMLKYCNSLKFKGTYDPRCGGEKKL